MVHHHQLQHYIYRYKEVTDFMNVGIKLCSIISSYEKPHHTQDIYSMRLYIQSMMHPRRCFRQAVGHKEFYLLGYKAM
jgi:hypothetical protein